MACQQGNKRMVKVCLRWGANINAQNNQGQTPLHYTVAYNYEALTEYLTSKGADPSVTNHFGLTCADGLRPDDEDEAIRLLRERFGDDAELSQETE
jgi:ankyrin repeat protein